MISNSLRRPASSLVAAIAFAATLIALAAATLANEPFTLTDADFRPRQIFVRKLDNSAVWLASDSADVTATPTAIPLDAMVQLTRTEPPRSAENVKGLVLCAAGGDRLIGQPKRIEGQSIVWFATGLGEVSVPLDQTLGILRDRTNDPKLLQARPEDEVRLATGDAVSGIVTEIGDRAIGVTPAGGGNAQPVPVESIAQLLFAAPPGGRPALAKPKYIVRLVNGTVLACKSLTITEDKTVRLVPVYGANAASQITTHIGQLAAIEHTGGPVTWLSSLTPSESAHTPYFTGAFPAQFDRTVTGEPIRFNGVTYSRGIGVHSRSKLVFALDATQAGQFRTRYAIEPALSYADVDVRVRVDGKVVHEKIGFRSGVMSDVVQVDLPADAKTLTLEVDYGKGYDVQDRLTWIEPALIRRKQ